MAKFVGRELDKDKVLRKLANAGLRVQEIEFGGKPYRFIDISQCKHAVGNRTLGELDFLANHHHIHYGRVTKHDFEVVA